MQAGRLVGGPGTDVVRYTTKIRDDADFGVADAQLAGTGHVLFTALLGAIVAWFNSGRVGAQHVHPNGVIDPAWPTNGAVLDQSPRLVQLDFNEEVEFTLGAMRLFDSGGQQLGLGPVTRVPGERKRSPRHAMSPIVTATVKAKKPRMAGPMPDSVKACTLSSTPDRVMNVPRMVSEKVAHSSDRFQTRNMPRRSCTITECR